jgi:hypothetical protein
MFFRNAYNLVWYYRLTWHCTLSLCQGTDPDGLLKNCLSLSLTLKALSWALPPWFGVLLRLYTVQYSPSDFLLLKYLWTHTRFYLLLRVAFFSPASNINVIAVNCLLDNKWGCIFDGNNVGLLSCAVLEGDWTQQRVWTQTILKERRWNGDGTETWRIVWIGPKTYNTYQLSHVYEYIATSR